MDGKDYIAYFTMEIGLTGAMPTYAGGLGILAGDTVRSAADLGIRMVAVTLLHRKGYFRQKLDDSGWQSEEDVLWPVAELLQEMKPGCSIEIEGRQVQLRAWKYEVKGEGGSIAPSGQSKAATTPIPRFSNAAMNASMWSRSWNFQLVLKNVSPTSGASAGTIFWVRYQAR